MTSDTFKHARDMVATKRKIAKAHGKGNKKNRSDPFTEDEIDILKQKGLLGADTPEALLNTIWLNNMLHFGLRGRQEHQTMLWGDVELLATSSGREYLAFTERLTKTRNGISADPRAFVPKMFSQPGNKDCPVEMFKRYAEKRPEKMNTPESSFYASLNPNYKAGSNISWFMNASMGRNKLGSIAKVMSEKANLSGKHTNHSGRKSMITQQLKKKVPPIHVAQLSGHQNLMSLNSYNTMSLEQQIEMSDNAHAINRVTASTSVSIEKQQMTDTELLAASQEIEEALVNIQHFENNQGNSSSVLDLPVLHHPDGSLSIQENDWNKCNPSKMFMNCTFNAPLNIVFK